MPRPGASLQAKASQCFILPSQHLTQEIKPACTSAGAGPPYPAPHCRAPRRPPPHPSHAPRGEGGRAAGPCPLISCGAATSGSAAPCPAWGWGRCRLRGWLKGEPRALRGQCSGLRLPAQPWAPLCPLPGGVRDPRLPDLAGEMPLPHGLRPTTRYGCDLGGLCAGWSAVSSGASCPSLLGTCPHDLSQDSLAESRSRMAKWVAKARSAGPDCSYHTTGSWEASRTARPGDA